MKAAWMSAAVVLWLGWPIAGLLWRGRRVALHDRRVVRRVRPCDARVLVVGDSSAAGTGASDGRFTVAGRLAAAHPRWSIGNLARKGRRTADVARLLARLRRRTCARQAAMPPYDLLVVHTGGNDALRGTALDALARAARDAVADARLLASRTVVVMGGNLALAPALPWPWSWLAGVRTRRVREVLQRAVPGGRVTFVDLFRERADDPTVGSPDRYFAADGLHPSDDNYALWFHHIEAELDPALRVQPSRTRGAALNGVAAPLDR